jgi:predicted membrane-bound mannosyltransferase
VALIGLGALLLAWSAFARVWNVGSRPLWQDEAALANAVRQLPAKDLLLQAEVSTPPLFALVSKLVGSRIARPELGLRLLPLLCGVLLVPLAYVTARTLAAPRSVALAGMSLTASSVMLVIWSREFRHYEIEAFLSTVLALLVFRLRRAARTQRIWPLVLGVLAVCAIGPWIGYGTIFSITALLA